MDQEREAFEIWLKQRYGLNSMPIPFDPDFYKWVDARMLWVDLQYSQKTKDSHDSD